MSLDYLFQFNWPRERPAWEQGGERREICRSLAHLEDLSTETEFYWSRERPAWEQGGERRENCRSLARFKDFSTKLQAIPSATSTRNNHEFIGNLSDMTVNRWVELE